MEAGTQIGDLPQPCLELIFLRLAKRYGLSEAAGVSKAWQKLAFETVTNLTLMKKAKYDLPSVKTLQRLQRFTNLKKLMIATEHCQQGARFTEIMLACRKDNGRDHLAELMRSCPKLTYLYLDGCNISKDVIVEHTSLKDLQLYNIRSPELPTLNLPNLETLKLDKWTRLESIGGLLTRLTPLTQLKWLSLLYASRLRTLPGNLFASLSQLEMLEMVKCSCLENIPTSVGELRGLQYLDIGQCSSLKCLPMSLCLLPSLTSLSISRCTKLHTLPNNVGCLEALVRLDIAHCTSLKELPVSIGELKNLTSLDAWGCTELLFLPDSIGNLRCLRKLHLGNCEELTWLPSSLANLTSLRVLSLVGCYQLHSVPGTVQDLINRLKGLSSSFSRLD